MKITVWLVPFPLLDKKHLLTPVAPEIVDLWTLDTLFAECYFRQKRLVKWLQDDFQVPDTKNEFLTRESP